MVPARQLARPRDRIRTGATLRPLIIKDPEYPDSLNLAGTEPVGREAGPTSSGFSQLWYCAKILCRGLILTSLMTPPFFFPGIAELNVGYYCCTVLRTYVAHTNKLHTYLGSNGYSTSGWQGITNTSSV